VTTAAVLHPLAARYVSWLTRAATAAADIPGNPDQVRAMPVVLRLERTDPPGRTPLLEAAAAAALAVCLDPRAAPGGEWHEAVATWIGGRIRKVARRARGAHWAAVQALPGVTVEVAGAQARALLPGRVVEAPREVSRLQIGGSDLPTDQPGPAPSELPVLWLNPHVPMTVGKAAAQVGHATMLLAAALHADGRDDAIEAWGRAGYRAAVRTATPQGWAGRLPGDDPAGAWRDRRVVAVRDAGFTEVAPGTVTVLAQWPAPG
jgi:peptidyl-tRNA hydrolase